MQSKNIQFTANTQQQLYNFLIDENNFTDQIIDDREKAILSMRLEYKHSYKTIGISLGLSHQRVFIIYNKALYKLDNAYTIFTKKNSNPSNSILIQSVKSLSNKSKSELQKNDISTLQELQRYRIKDLTMFTRIGKKTINEIKAVFVEYNLKFSDT